MLLRFVPMPHLLLPGPYAYLPKTASPRADPWKPRARHPDLVFWGPFNLGTSKGLSDFLYHGLDSSDSNAHEGLMLGPMWDPTV